MKYIKPDKILYHPERLSAWMNEETVKPITAEIHLSNRCNNACYYCGQKQNQNGKDMSIENIKMLRKFVDYSGVKSVYFSGGGEPTLNQNLFTVLDELHGIEKGIITNGLIMPDNLIDRYVREFRWVRISIDSADTDTYYKIRGTYSFEIVKNNVQRLLTYKKESNSSIVIGLQIVVNEFNNDKIFEIVRDLLNFFPDIDYINIRPIEAKINETPYSFQDLRILKREFESLKNNKKVIISEKWQNIFADKKEFGFKVCNAGEFIVTITADADIYQCCHVTHLDDYRITNLCDYTNYFYERQITFNGITNKGFNPKICPLGCRGSGINKSIESMIKENHKNFL